MKSIKALIVSLNGIFKIIDEKLDGLVDSIKTLSDDQILGVVNSAKDTADAALAIATENKRVIHRGGLDLPPHRPSGGGPLAQPCIFL